ncbi:MAG: hypothetical protein C0448_14940 [Sphingobacteriaceae bacterium]|nr:hypothetical protein [Sphingobacteriaceae bacterium]
MLLNKLFLAISLLLFLSFSSKAQVYKAGDVFTGYADITPDTLINYVFPPYSSSESYYFNINNDSIDDFIINARALNANGQGNDYIIVKSLNPNLCIRSGRIDSVLLTNGFWWISNVAKPLIYGDTINSLNAIWDSTSLFLTENSFFASAHKNLLDWATGSDLFIGFRYQTTMDTIYGWVRVNIPYANNFVKNCYIKDYSTTGFIDGINEINEGVKEITTYPNPVTNTLNLSTLTINLFNSKIEIVNTLGQTVLKQPYSKSVDVTSLPNGFYTLKVAAIDKQIFLSKFIKE